MRACEQCFESHNRLIVTWTPCPINILQFVFEFHNFQAQSVGNRFIRTVSRYSNCNTVLLFQYICEIYVCMNTGIFFYVMFNYWQINCLLVISCAFVHRKARRKDKETSSLCSDEPKLYLEQTVLERKLPDIDLRVLVDLPAGLDYNEWLASHSKYGCCYVL